MKTLTAAEARQNPSSPPQAAIQGEGEAAAFRPVMLCSEDYALQEHGVTAAMLARAEANLRKQLTRETATEWDGTVARLKT